MVEEKKEKAPASAVPTAYMCRECGTEGFCEHRGKKPEDGPCGVYPDKRTKWVEEPQSWKRGGSRK